MSPDGQRIAIAEACGITAYDDRPDYGFNSSTGIGCQVPDFLHRLDAMQEAVETLSDGDKKKWASTLSRVVGRGCLPWPHQVYNATAAQRAEAFLRTKGKWEDE